MGGDPYSEWIAGQARNDGKEEDRKHKIG